MTLVPTIGLEIHVQLQTRTKMFCSCALSFGEPPNTRTCPVCLGLPGTLPVINAEAINCGLMIGAALGCELAPRSIFHRKNYFYPDLPKGYQISQYDEPLCRGGRLGDVRIHRVHLEEDAAKLIHVGTSGRIHGADSSVVDFNRGGTPLVEIVSEPDLHDPEQARVWLQLLAATMRQLGVSDVRMEEGSLRCDANVSLADESSTALGTKTELKNMNSFSFVKKGIEAEIARQRDLLERGEAVVQETLHFDPRTGELSALRSKEEAHDYRYFPEPDLVPIAIDEAMLARARAAVGELPAARIERYERELGLSAEFARQFAFRPELGAFFEAALAADGDQAPPPRELATWIAHAAAALGERDPADTPLRPAALAGLARLVHDGRVAPGPARDVVLPRLLDAGGDPGQIVEQEGVASLEDGERLAEAVAAAIAANPEAAERVRGGNAKAIGPIIGHVMRATQGRADGGEVTRLVHEQLA
jgi:aspartyl-tRNA(Asn)/glutamyl-tRNA(Gln) amidotransferase subunit B